MFDPRETTPSSSEHLVRMALQEFAKQSEPLVRELILESQDLELERLRQELRDQLQQHQTSLFIGRSNDTLPGAGDTLPSMGRSREQVRELLSHLRPQFDALRERAVVVARGLQALQDEWRYLERHSVLQDDRKRDILMHLSCSGRLGDRYEVFEQINEGGHSRIFRAQCKATGALRALKVLEARSRSVLLPRFLIEGSVGKRQLDHPRLVKIHDFGGFFNPEHHFGEYFIACELLEGETLHRWIRSHPYRGQSDAPHTRMMQEMIESLGYLHSEGFIHCDVNPHNFFVVEGDSVKLLDFGIIESIRDIESLSASQAISAAQSMGGPLYQAPEQVDSFFGKPTPKTDVYGLGVTLFELFAGQLPFGSASSLGHKLQFAPIQSLPARPRELLQDLLPHWLDALVVRCLEKEPRQRPSLHELHEVIEHVLAFRIDDERLAPLIEELSRKGFDSFQVLQEKITHIRSQFLKKLSPEEMRFVPMAQLERAEDLVVSQVRREIETNLRELHSLLSGMEPWDPLLQVCPNLLCRENYRRGQQHCPSCGTSWMLSCADFFAPCSQVEEGNTNSFFAERCQEPSCHVVFARPFKIEAVYNKTLQVGLQQKQCDAAAITLLVVGEHLASMGETVNFGKYYQRCLDALAPERKARQTEILDSIREEWERLSEEAQREFGILHPGVVDRILEEARLLRSEGRIRDSLQQLQRIPPASSDERVLALRNELHEHLTAAALQKATEEMETAQRQLQQIEQELDELTPDPPESLSNIRGIRGWLQSVETPLDAGASGCSGAAVPLDAAVGLIEAGEALVLASQPQVHRTRTPVEDAIAEVRRVASIIQELESAFKNKQMQGVEPRLNLAQATLDVSEEVLEDTGNTLLAAQGELDQARVKLGQSRRALDEAGDSFEETQDALELAQTNLALLEKVTEEVQPHVQKARSAQAVLREGLQRTASLLQEVAYPSQRQEALLQKIAAIEASLKEGDVSLLSRESQHKQLDQEAQGLVARLKTLEATYRDEVIRQEKLVRRVTEIQGEEESLRKSLEERLQQVRQARKHIAGLRERKEKLMREEQARRNTILRTAISWGTVGALIGIAAGLGFGWWLFARNVTLPTPNWLEATLWGAGMGCVMVLAVVLALGRQVFQQPLFVTLAGAVAGAGISVVLHWMKVPVLGSAIGVLTGAIIGWTVGGGVGALWNVRKMESWRTLEKALTAARYGAMLGVFAGASAGGYLGHTRLLQASVSTWILLTLASVSLLALLTTTIGYFVAGGAWVDLKQASEAEEATSATPSLRLPKHEEAQ